MKLDLHDAGHMIKMATMPVYGKILLKSFLCNQWNDFDETWHLAPGIPAHHSLFKNRPWVERPILAMSNYALYRKM